MLGFGKDLQNIENKCFDRAWGCSDVKFTQNQCRFWQMNKIAHEYSDAIESWIGDFCLI